MQWTHVKTNPSGRSIIRTNHSLSVSSTDRPRNGVVRDKVLTTATMVIIIVEAVAGRINAIHPPYLKMKSVKNLQRMRMTMMATATGVLTGEETAASPKAQEMAALTMAAHEVPPVVQGN